MTSITKCTNQGQKINNTTIAIDNVLSQLVDIIHNTKNGNEYRAATGEPGPKYWQNRADYQLDVKLNEATNEIAGTEILSYTNNSPLKLNFIWMQLDQNLFKKIYYHFSGEVEDLDTAIKKLQK